jgi:Transposon-encoded protein TnpV
MATPTELPYWANEYVTHIRAHRPEMYEEMVESGELEQHALSIQSSAQAYYDQLFAHNKAQGENDTTADFYAKGDVMREYILLPTEQDVPELYENMDGMAEEPEDAFEPGHLEFLKLMSETIVPSSRSGAFRRPSANS